MTPHDEDMLQLVDRLRERLEGWATESVRQAGEIGDLKRWLAEAEGERDALAAAVETLSARHQPKQATQWIRCNRHVKALSTDVALFLRCTNCRKEPVTVCSNITCCEWPCEDRRALDAALDAFETSNSKEILSGSDAPETPGDAEEATDGR